MKEYETKVLDINQEEVEKKLADLGSERIHEVLQRRWVFDINPEAHEWIRLRDDGIKTNITYKKKTGTGISETEEIEVEVDDFEKARKILSAMDFKGKYYQENKRILYKLDDIEFTIDKWPNIPTLLEIESTSEEKVRKGLEMIGMKDAGNLSVKEVYKKYGIDLHSVRVLTFE